MGNTSSSGWAKAVAVSIAAACGLVACAGEPAPTAPPADTPAGAARQAFVEALRPRPGRTLPLVAVLALNEGTETTDFLVPHAVLRRASGLRVEAVAPRRGLVTLMPALSVRVDTDFAGFDQAHPDGADYVVVPALHAEDDPAVRAWLRSQAARGAIVIGVCSGARVLARAGLLDGREFTGHWHDRGDLAGLAPGSRHLPDRRYAIDRGVATTTGVSASLPVALALVEAVDGSARAAALAGEYGLSDWGPAHRSAEFRLRPGGVLTYLWNGAAFWAHETMGIAVRDGDDDVQLAFAADAWARSGRSEVIAVGPAASTSVRLRSGLALSVTPPGDAGKFRPLTLPTGLPPARQLDLSLCEIGRRHGDATRRWVALLMEHPLPGNRPQQEAPGCDAPSPPPS